MFRSSLFHALKTFYSSKKRIFEVFNAARKCLESAGVCVNTIFLSVFPGGVTQALVPA